MFNVEYNLATSKFCPQANSSSYNFNSILKDVNLYDVPYTLECSRFFGHQI